MNYIIFDLEFNQKHPDNKDIIDNNKNLLFEIIQIGAIKIDSNFKTIETFDQLINPTVHTILHPYVENLTNININDLNLSKNFTEVFKSFVKFLGDDEVVLVVWGTSDIKELLKNVDFYGMSTSLVPNKYIDIQAYASKLFKYEKGTKIGLKSAVEKLEININGEFHNAFNDAYYTNEVFKKIYNKKEIKPCTYSLTLNKRVSNTPKEKSNLKELYAQFEKMYSKNLTKEEKSMIRLAYFMGKTNQFTDKK